MQVQAQGFSVKWKSTSTQAQAQLRCNFYPIEVGASDLVTTDSYPGSLSVSSDDNGGKGEKRWVRGWFGQTLDQHVLVLLSVSMCIISTQARRRYKEKEKNCFYLHLCVVLVSLVKSRLFC